MEKRVYSIYDKKLERFNEPGFGDDDKTMQISLSRSLKDKSSFLYVNREDLALYCIGVFDDKKGIVALENDRDIWPYLVCDISNLVEE